MKFKNLDLNTLQEVRKHWVNSAISQGDVSEASLELIEQFFDFIEQNHNYGDYYTRSNTNTFIGVDLDEDGVIDVLAEVIYYRRGRIKTFKIMDIYYSPAIEVLEESSYDYKCIQTLVYIVNQFVHESSDAVGGSTKIYARTSASLKYLTQLHAVTQDEEVKKEFEAAGLEVYREGERWLAFRVKK
ncbi:MAG: hypothetical protein ACRCVQ_08140 [Acinetobacter ursingii]|uniref:hypothetical protein n=2 Tax=Acinetobacter ursingii TaxID=108980 RepID=UPI00125057B8|nr:hypothetical protein [Acinetobacter ursingii]